jgi:hypothetical protein
MFMPQQVVADGTEQLGPPVGLTVASGTGIIAAGVGLDNGTGMGTIEFTVPAGAVVKQVILYWEGQTTYGGPLEHNFFVNGEAVNASDPLDETDGGDRIGAPIKFYYNESLGSYIYAVAYRYDITEVALEKNLVRPGPNTLEITEFDAFGFSDDGLGVLVIYEEPMKPASVIQLRDGIDLAFAGFDEPEKKTTVAQTFTFEAASVDRVATLCMFFSSVEGNTSGAGPFRPNSVEITIGDNVTVRSNMLNSHDGPEWDTEVIIIPIAAGATSLTVQAFSRNDGDPANITNPIPASFFWLAAGLSVPNVPEGGQGCTPGYWRQPQHFGNWTAPYTPDMLFNDVFEDAFPGMTLLDVVQIQGGGLNALGRHTVAALLNAAHSSVNFGMSVQDVIDQFDGVYPGSKGTYETLKDILEDLNEQGCSLGRADLGYGPRPGLRKGQWGDRLLQQNYPNPFNPETAITFEVPEGGSVSLAIFNSLGEQVRVLADGVLEAGTHVVRWDGRNDAGRPLSSGVYLYRLRVGGMTDVRTMILAK